MMSLPQDGPATTNFIPDPHLIKLPKNQHQHHHPQHGRDGKGANQQKLEIGTDFGLVLVAGWPPNLSILEKPYHHFLEKVKQCFDENDWNEANPLLPNVYLYPVQHLHITIATLRAFTHPTPSASQQAEISKYYKNLIISASKQEGWPKSKFTLVIDGAQIGKKAGILLWKETSGNLDAMRACLSKELENRRGSCGPGAGCGCGVGVGGEKCVALDTVFIPNIVHSTFLRFSDRPKSDGMTVQTKFGQLLSTKNDQGNMDRNHINGDDIGDSEGDLKKRRTSKLSELQNIFKERIEIDSVRLVNERTPYMHIPCDEDHVLHSFELT